MFTRYSSVFLNGLKTFFLLFNKAVIWLQLCIVRGIHRSLVLTKVQWFGKRFMMTFHDDVIKRKHFPRYWPFVRGIHRSLVNSPHKGQWRGALMFSLICARINAWVNNGEAGDLRRHRAHYDVTVMSMWCHHITLPFDNVARWQHSADGDIIGIMWFYFESLGKPDTKFIGRAFCCVNVILRTAGQPFAPGHQGSKYQWKCFGGCCALVCQKTLGRMMTSFNGNAFRTAGLVTDGFLSQKTTNVDLWRFLRC